MGKLNNALSMLAILRSRTRVTRKELAEILEVSEREITRYKDDLEAAGLTINSVRGKYGYYEIANKDFLLNLDLSESELTTLDMATDYFKDQQIHLYKDFQHINDKIKAASGIDFQEAKGNYYSKGVKIRADYDGEKKKWLTINEGIITCRKVEMTYINANGEGSSRVVNPYGLFTYYNSNFFVGYCNKRQEIRSFKLIRIKEVKILSNEKFERVDFDLKEYLDNNVGLISDGECYLKLKIKYPYATGFKEFKWLEDELIEEHKKDGFIIYSAKARGFNDTLNWIMGMGSNCEVIEPKAMKEALVNEIKTILGNYNM